MRGKKTKGRIEKEGKKEYQAKESLHVRCVFHLKEKRVKESEKSMLYFMSKAVSNEATTSFR